MRFRSRDLRNDRIAKRSSRGSRYVDYIVLTGGSSARRCTKASTTLAHISPCFHLPTHSLCLSLSLRVFTPFSYFPIHRSANVIVSLRSSSDGLPLLHFYVLFTSEVHVSLSGSLVHFAAALFPIFVLPRFVSVYRNICSSCEQDKREYFMHFRLRRKRGNTRPAGSSVLSISPSFLLSRLCDRAPKPMAAREEIFKTTALVSLDTIRSTIYGVPFDKTKPFVYVHIPFTNSTRTIEPSDSLYRIVQKSTVHGYRK